MDHIFHSLGALLDQFIHWYQAGGLGPYCLWATGGVIAFAALAAILYRPTRLMFGYQEVDGIWYSRAELSAIFDSVERIQRASRRSAMPHETIRI